MKLSPFAYLAALLPLLTIHLCYLVAASHNHVDWCIPYWHSCTSISATGREGIEFYLFKGLMIPASVILGCYWYLCQQWIKQLNLPKQEPNPILRNFFIGITVLASAGLVLYSVMLGAIGDIYQLQRRIGVTLFFGLSYIAQLILTWQLSRIQLIRNQNHRLFLILELSAFLVLLVGVGSIVWAAIEKDYYDSREDAVEWIFTLLLCLHAMIVARLWQITGYSSSFKIELKGQQ